MAYQLVYTSAAKLLDAGRTGFGTVARSKTLSPLVVSAIERVSQFANIRGTDRSRVIFVHRRIIAANNRLHVLSRITDAGADYTGRTNHIAHHLIVSQEEVARAAARGLTPADILRQFPWLDRWDGAARFFAASDDVSLDSFRPLGKQAGRKEWTRITHNPAHARLLAWEGAPRNGVLLVPPGADPLALMAEAFCEFGSQSWSRTFTTSLETTDEMSDLDWIVTTPAVFREIQSRCGARVCLDLSQPQSLPVPPESVQATPEADAANQVPAMPETTQDKRAAEEAVRVRTLEGSASGRKSSRAPLVLKPEKKQNTLILTVAIAAAVTLVLGLIVWKTITPKGNGEKVQTAVKLNDPQQQAVRDMTKAGISEDHANDVARSAGDQATAWGNFITGFLGKIQDVKTITDLQNLPRPPSETEPSGAPPWLGSLVVARSAVPNLGKASSADNELIGFLRALGEFSKPLESAASGLSIANFTSDYSKKLDGSLCEKEIERRFKFRIDEINSDHLIQESHIRQLHDSITNSQFSANDWPARYQVLCKLIKNHFNYFESNVMKEAFSTNDSPTYFNKADYDGFKLAIGYLAEPEKILSQADQAIIESSSFVPNPFEDYRKKKINQKNEKQAENTGSPPVTPDAEKKPSGANMEGVNQKQVIVVSQKQLKDGVELELLKKILNDFKEDKTPSGLTITLENGQELTEIKRVQKYEPEKGSGLQEYFEPDSKTLKIQKDGIISVDSSEIKLFKVSYKNNGKEWVSYVVDDSKDIELVSGLKFKFESESKSEDKVKIKIIGEVTEWMKSTTNSEHKKIDLTVVVPGFEFEEESNEYFLSKESTNKPLLFAASDIEKVREGLKKLEDKNGEISRKGGGSEKTKLEGERQGIIDSVKSSLSTAIGGAILLEHLKVINHNKIDKNQWGKAKEVLRVMGITRKGEYNDDWNKDINDIKVEIGRKQFDEKVKNGVPKYLNCKDWNELSKSPTTLIKFVESLIEKSNNYKPQRSIEEDLQSVTIITVKTHKGRVLFKATKHP